MQVQVYGLIGTTLLKQEVERKISRAENAVQIAVAVREQEDQLHAAVQARTA